MPQLRPENRHWYEPIDSRERVSPKEAEDREKGWNYWVGNRERSEEREEAERLRLLAQKPLPGDAQVVKAKDGSLRRRHRKSEPKETSK